MASPREMNNPLSTADDKPRSLLSQDELRESLSLDQSSSPKGVDRTATMFEQEMVVANDSGEEDDGDEAKERSLATKSLLVTIQTGITLGFGPFAVLFLLTVVGDCLIFSPHIHGRNTEPKLEGSFIQFLNMIVFPAMSFGAASYMMVSYWMDSDSWTMLRRCLMFSTIPMIIFYGLMLMGQSENFQMGTTCTFRAYVMQVVRAVPGAPISRVSNLRRCLCSGVLADEHVAHDDCSVHVPHGRARNTKVQWCRAYGHQI